MSTNFLSRIKAFDVYQKTEEDYQLKTFIGGAISLISVFTIFVLIISEFWLYLEPTRIDSLQVDMSPEQTIPIHINITFPSVNCKALHIDVMDVSGEQQIDVDSTIFKTRLSVRGTPITGTTERINMKNELAHNAKKTQAAGDKKTTTPNPGDTNTLVTQEKNQEQLLLEKLSSPNYCGSCYGADTFAPKRDAKGKGCCNTCDDVKEAYRKNGWSFKMTPNIEQCHHEINDRRTHSLNQALEGCNLSGFFVVNKVAGNFHFAPGKSSHEAASHVHDYLPFEVDNFNSSHIINSLAFGSRFPGQTKNPLDGARKIIDEKVGNSGLFQYFIKVIPTKYESKKEKIPTNQYSVTSHFRPRNLQHPQVVPGVFFMYDLSPIMMTIREEKKSFLHFITNLCAIVGGVYTVFSIIDSIMFRINRSRSKRRNLVTN